MEDNKPINDNCWVAYFDVLGFRKIVKELYTDYIKIKDCYLDYIRETFKKALAESSQFNVICRFKHFSDTFIFYTENDKSDSFLKIRAVSMYFFDIMFTQNNIPYFPMRGCLDIGHFYSDEKYGIFFGQALIDAYELAEDQNWIGFVLSEKAIAKIKEYELAGVKTDNELWFQEYNVPCKKETKEKNLFAYKMNSLFGGSQNINFPIFLRSHLSRIGSEALDLLGENNRCSKCKNILAKYQNTEKYLISIYPLVRNERKMFDQEELCSSCPKKKDKLKNSENTM